VWVARVELILALQSAFGPRCYHSNSPHIREGFGDCGHVRHVVIEVGEHGLCCAALVCIGITVTSIEMSWRRSKCSVGAPARYASIHMVVCVLQVVATSSMTAPTSITALALQGRCSAATPCVLLVCSLCAGVGVPSVKLLFTSTFEVGISVYLLHSYKCLLATLRRRARLGRA